MLIRAGRILDGGTTAPARSEAVVPLSAGTGALAAVCRRLLADAAADAAPSAPGRARAARPRRTARSARPGRHTGLASWVVIACVVALVAFCVHSIVATGR
ncbi:hypothetical protein ACFQ2B_30285 [Streptomyces stramineus]